MAIPYTNWKCPYCGDIEEGYYVEIKHCVRRDYYDPKGEMVGVETEGTFDSEEECYCTACRKKVEINWIVE